MLIRTRRLISSARDRPTWEVMVRRGVSCFRDCTRMDGVEGAVKVVPEGFDDTADCSVDFESRPLLLVVEEVSIDSTNVTATAACECDSVSLEELGFVLHTLLDWV